MVTPLSHDLTMLDERIVDRWDLGGSLVSGERTVTANNDSRN